MAHAALNLLLEGYSGKEIQLALRLPGSGTRHTAHPEMRIRKAPFIATVQSQNLQL